MDIRRIKSRAQIEWYLAKIEWWVPLAGIGAVLGILPVITGCLTEWRWPPAGITLAGIVVALLSLLLMWLAGRGRCQAGTCVPVEVDDTVFRALRLGPRYSGYKLEWVGSVPAAYSPAVNAYLGTHDLTYTWAGNGGFRLGRAGRLVARYALRKASEGDVVLENDPKVRLASDLLPEPIESTESIKLEPTCYFHSVCTNEMVRTRLRARGGNSLVFDGLSLMSDGRQVDNLEDTKCSNHIGLSTLAITSLGRMIVSTQTSRNAQSRSRLCPTGSGSADPGDLAGKTGSFQQFVIRAAERELHEECWLTPEELASCRTLLMGFARVLRRGGKPEFFAVTFVDSRRDDFYPSKADRTFIADCESIPIGQDIATIGSRLEKFRRERRDEFSPSLHLNLLFLQQFADEHPEQFAHLAQP